MAYSLYHLLLLMITMASSSSSVSSLLNREGESQALRRVISQLFNGHFQTNLSSGDFCAAEPSRALTVVCYEGAVTQLHINGGLEEGEALGLGLGLGLGSGSGSVNSNFSTHSLFASLARLSNLKVLTLSSLGMSGHLPGSVGRLSSLEILNVSSNKLAGEIPVQILHLRNLQTLVLDRNSFAGKIPFWVNALPALTVLSLGRNSLSGSLPSSLGLLRNLRVLILSGNKLSGPIPSFKTLTNLQILDLGDNQFGPNFPVLPRKLVSLVLRDNRFRFGINPEELSGMYLLQKLDISRNGFAGPFSASLLSLPSIKYLDVSRNKFTGAFLNDTSCSPELVFVNLSSNYLAGKLPRCLELGSRVVGYSGNCFSGGGDRRQRQHSSDFCRKEALAVEVLPNKERPRVNGRPVLVSGLAGGIVGCVLIVGLVSILVKKAYVKEILRKPSKTTPTRFITENVSDNNAIVNTAKLLSNAKYISETMKLGASLPAYRTFSLEEIKEATNDFDAATLMSENSHGQIYRGELSDGTIVAIRSLKMQKKRTPQAYTHHLELISKLRHCHLVSALGHCLECQLDDSCVTRIFLVFEFAPNGTLRNCVSASQGHNLNWTQRISAAIGVTKGVQFLHTGTVPGVYSNNLKITNVLMDHNMQVKIGGYNIPLLAENVGTAVHSSIPRGGSQHCENHEDKNDVYDIGVILLEIILGRPILFRNEVGTLKDLVRVSLTTDETGRRSITDPAVQKQCSDESLKTTMEICVRCLETEPGDRPSVGDVLWTLQFAAQVQDSCTGDSMNSIDSLHSLHCPKD